VANDYFIQTPCICLFSRAAFAMCLSGQSRLAQTYSVYFKNNLICGNAVIAVVLSYFYIRERADLLQGA
jgi:hypothetical protein